MMIAPIAPQRSHAQSTGSHPAVPVRRVARWRTFKGPLAAVALALLLLAWESAGGPVSVSAKYAEQITSGQLARNIAHSGGRFLHDVVMSLITRNR